MTPQFTQAERRILPKKPIEAIVLSSGPAEMRRWDLTSGAKLRDAIQNRPTEEGRKQAKLAYSAVKHLVSTRRNNGVYDEIQFVGILPMRDVE